ncbi:MAG: PIN domain-containing protein [Thermoguttaceae bacterium]
MQAEVFLDTVYAVALAATSDLLHERAVIISEQLEKEGARLITTQAILLEIGNALSKNRYRTAAIEILSSLESDPSVEIIPLSTERYTKAFNLYKSRPDKEWGLIDCFSFVVMEELGIKEALTSDEHFEQAGYHALLG